MTGPCELIVIDNASAEPVTLPDQLRNSFPVKLIRLDRNIHTAARNIGAQEARGDWLCMLDDDSALLPCPLLELLTSVPDEVAAVGGEITLPGGSRESGGLPEVIVGCGCVIRRDAFLRVGGYDESFGYYAEEYDLCAKLINAGDQIRHSRSIRFEHRRSAEGRDFNEIMFRLVRNNAWVIQRYAPESVRRAQIDEMLSRYKHIADRELAMTGYQRGIEALEDSIDRQPRAEMQADAWDRFTGVAAVRARFARLAYFAGSTVHLIGEPHAKGRGGVSAELGRIGCEIDQAPTGTAVIGGISPGPMLDLADRNPGAIAPWIFE